MKTNIITITPPTPNGDLHIGHIAGPFLSADVFRRVRGLFNETNILVSYSDDYQSYMARKEIELDEDRIIISEKNTVKITNSLNLLDIKVDKWLKPEGNKFFLKYVDLVFNNLKKVGAVSKEETLVPHCEKCDVWAYEAFARGNCNHCGNDSDPSQCESCAGTPDVLKMKNLKCKLCSNSMTTKPVERYVLNLAPFSEFLKLNVAHNQYREPLNSWLDNTIPSLEKWGVTRPGDAGLTLNDNNQPINTWFMGMSGYLSCLAELFDEGKIYKTPEKLLKNKNNNLVHFLGFDCVYSHCLLYPIIYNSIKNSNAKQHFIPNQFLKLNGDNLSTSRNHAIWIEDIAKKYSSDSIRLYLSKVSPEECDTNFDTDSYHNWDAKYFKNVIPCLMDALESAEKDCLDISYENYSSCTFIYDKWKSFTDKDNFSIAKQADIVCDILDDINCCINSGESYLDKIPILAISSAALAPNLSNALVNALRVNIEQIINIFEKKTMMDYVI